MLDLNETLIFARVAQEGSFTKAALALGLPKSTVSRKVVRLEERLGVRLIQRTSRRVALTDAGQEHLRRCGPLLVALSEAEEELAENRTELRGTIRMSAAASFAEAFLGPLLVEFLRSHPKVRIEVILSDRMVDLVADNFDLAIRAGQLKDSGLVVRRLGPTLRRIVASPRYLASRGTPTEPEELRSHACLAHAPLPGATNWRFRGPNGPISVPIAGPLVVNSFELLKEAVLADLGIAAMPAFACAREIARGRLVPLLDDRLVQGSSLSLVFPSRHQPRRVRAFADHLVEKLGAAPWMQPAPTSPAPRVAKRRAGSR